jgi:cell division protein FtsB
MNLWRAIYRFSWIALVVLIAISLVCAFLPKCHQLRELQRQKAQLEAENRQAAAQTQELQAKEGRFRSDAAFVERVAKENGMLKPDEIVFRFTNEQAQSRAPRGP